MIELEIRPIGSVDAYVSSRIAELEKQNSELKKQVEELRRDCAEAYQVVGSAMTEPYPHYTESDVERVLDNLSAAANGDQRPHDDLLPWPMNCKARICIAKARIKGNKND